MDDLRKQADMTDATCSVDGCGRTERLRRDLCPKHYTRWRRHGDPRTVNPRKIVTCSVANCGRGGKITQGLCDPHYRRWRKTGDPGEAQIAHRAKVKPPCSVSACEKTTSSKGYCELHYRRWKRTGDPGPAEYRPRTPEERKARARELAREFYLRNREKNLARNKQYYRANRELAAEAGRAWRAANPSYSSNHAKAWYKANPERAREIWADKGGRRRERMQLTLTGPISYKFLLATYGMVCHLCGGPIAKGTLSWDHVIPLARGGTHTEDNLKPAHRRCNSRKGAREGLPSDASPRP